MVLFGDLVLGKSIGITPVSNPQYVSNNVFGYVSGNCINFVDTRTTSKHDGQQSYLKKTTASDDNSSTSTTTTPSSQTSKNLPSIVAENQITAFASFHWEGIIAYSQKGSSAIRFVKYPSLVPVGVNEGILQAPNDLEIVSLAFSSDGQYLASLGSIPNHTICVWDWRGAVARGHVVSQGSNNQGNETETTKSNAAPSPLLCSTSNGAPAISISFNPKDKRVLCTSNPGFGGIGRTDRVGTEVDSSVDELDVNVMIGSNIGLCRGIHFWKIEMRYRKWDLRSMPIKESDSENFSQIHQKKSAALAAKLNVVNAGSSKNLNRKLMIARNHVWTPDQTVLCTTNVKDCMVYYNPYQGTSYIVPPIEPESNNPNKDNEQILNSGYRAYENLASSKQVADEAASSKHNKNAKEQVNQRRSTLGRPSKVGSMSEKDELKHHREQQQQQQHHEQHLVAAPISPMPTVTSSIKEDNIMDWDIALESLCMNSILMAKDLSLVSGGSDGVVRYFSYDPNSSKLYLRRLFSISSLQKESREIISLSFSPDQTEFIAESADKKIYVCQIYSDTSILVVNNDASKVSCLDSFLITRKCVTAGSDGNVLIWDIQVDDEMNLSSSANASTNISSIARSLYSAGAHAFGVSIKDKMNVSGVSFTSLATNPMSSSLVALGSSKGFLRIYNLRISDELVFSDEDYQQLYKDESETAEESGKESGEAAKKEISDDDSEKLKRVKKMLSQDHQPQLLFRERMHSSPIQKVLFDPAGRFLITAADDGKAFLIDINANFKVLGYFAFNGTLRGISWNSGFEEEENPEASVVNESIFFYLLASDDIEGYSYINRFTIPFDTSILEHNPNQKMKFTKSSVFATTYKIDSILTDISIVPSHLYAGKETFYVLSADRKLSLYNGPSASLAATSNQEDRENDHDDALLVGKPISEIIEHDKDDCHMLTSQSIEWLLTWSKDGFFTVRNLMESDHATRVLGHDSFQGGIKAATLISAGQCIVTLGRDGLVKAWRWKYSAIGKRQAAEAVSEFARMISVKEKDLRDLSIKINLIPGLDDSPDSDSEAFFITTSKSQTLVEEKVDIEKEAYVSGISNKIEDIRKKLSELIVKNDTLPSIEKIDREEFVIDFDERDRLLAESDLKVRNVRKDIEDSNLVKTIIKTRIKKECWDSMEVNGQTVRSFHPDPLTNKIIEVTNYPLRKRSPEEFEFASKIKLLRKVQIEVAKATHPKQKKAIKDSDNADDDERENEGLPSSTKKADNAGVASAVEKEQKGIVSLLYDPFDLITSERRRMQANLLQEYMLELKTDFNDKFNNFFKVKNDEIAKIEEKNERIKGILEELQIQEAIFHPELDESEVPERIIEVQDSEVLAEKFITPEERKRLEEKRAQDEERMRLNKQDNWAERALQMMMGGKLEDRTEHEEKEELVRPEWMNKPREEMNEEERKLVKDFEKKLATFKEEQEKYKKALETELRKLQSFIVELCDTFDKNLQDFFNTKLKTDQLILQTKLKLLKLSQSSLFSEQDESREKGILSRLEQLKSEKIGYMAEIPEIKKDMERSKEEYELLLKKDKDLDRQFKKEFHGYDFYYDSLLKLFKKRESAFVDDAKANATESALPTVQPSIEKPSTIWDEPRALSIEIDMPEGLSVDLWNKLVELRERKIASERECRMAYNRFQEMQTLVQAVLDESERIRNETEKLTSDLNQFLEYKFHNTYNVESLFELKQGQVEIPQAPVVTDYSDAVLIHRSVVEKLNESIGGLGKAKVDALREMKEYRKGIHALEWENKMLDFQAEDQIIRTRDIQLLRLTKQMQEYLRSGDEHAQTTEIVALEKRADYSQKSHSHKLEDKQKILQKLRKRIKDKMTENSELDSQLDNLDLSVAERKNVAGGSIKHKEGAHAKSRRNLSEIYTRRRLVDLAKSQAQDIAILREEVERLRLRTYPAFLPSTKR